MSEHGHVEHGHGDHGGHDAHGGHGEHGHGEHWGDYNALPPDPNPLPPLSPALLGAFGVALAILVGIIVVSSFNLAVARHESPSLGHAEKDAHGH